MSYTVYSMFQRWFSHWQFNPKERIKKRWCESCPVDQEASRQWYPTRDQSQEVCEFGFTGRFCYDYHERKRNLYSSHLLCSGSKATFECVLADDDITSFYNTHVGMSDMGALWHTKQHTLHTLCIITNKNNKSNKKN